MAKFWVDFSASIEIEAESKAEVMKKACEEIPLELEFVEINSIEETTED